MTLVADGMHKLCEFADPHDINVVIENHGGLSSNAKWLVQTIRMANHKRAAPYEFSTARTLRRI